MAKQLMNGFVDLREKWNVYCRIVRPLGHDGLANEHDFYLRILIEAGEISLEPNSDDNERLKARDTARNRFNGKEGYFKAGQLPPRLVQRMESWRPGLDVKTFRTGSVSTFKAHLEELGAMDLCPTLEKLNTAMDHYRKDRPELQQWAIEYYKDKSHEVEGLENFPLILGAHFIPKEPVEISKDDVDKLELYLSPVFRSDEYFEKGMRTKDAHADHVHFRKDYKEKVLKKKSTTHNGFSYRLIKIDATPERQKLWFERSRYLSYINTCESRGFEAAYFHRHMPNRDASEMRTTELCGHRFGKSDIFDLETRNAVAGVSTIVIIVDRDGTKEPKFIRHRRGQDIDEAVLTDHVVPAGTFQPTLRSDIGDQEGQAAERWCQDFQIRENVIREFLEECRNLDKAIDSATRQGQDWRTASAAARPYKSLTDKLKDRKEAKLFYLGLGLDPLTEKPELLTALVIDKALAENLKFNYEGQGHKDTVFSRSNLRDEINDPNGRWLSAGMACLRLAHEHYDTLVNCLKRQ